MFKLIGSLTYLHLFFNAVDQKFLAFLRVLNMLLFYFLFQIGNNCGSRIDADITHDKNLFDLVIKIIVNIRKSAENSVHAGHNVISGLCQTLCQTSEKTFSLLCHNIFLLFIQIIFNQIDRYQSGYTLLLHGDTIQPVCRIHRTTSVGDNNKLRIFGKLM